MPNGQSAKSGIVGLLDAEPFRQSRDAAMQRQTELHGLLSSKIERYTTEDTSLVVFGSLARGEQTFKSDLDWTYLIDGQANSDHLKISQRIQEVLSEAKYGAPGPTGTFGNMAFSHDIIHQIGGQNDTNKNMTQRVLLLLESRPIGDRREAYDRVLNAVINRYLEEDTHLLESNSDKYRVPRFLLNDIVRFWRTMAVDFASKQRDRAGKGWGLRNAKLRMSRKLIFASGMLVCFSANLDPELKADISTEKSGKKLNLVNHLRNLVELTPLQILARCMEQYGVSFPTAESLFGSYAEFLKLLDDEGSRSALDKLRSEDSRSDTVFKEVRRISSVFEKALDHIFFENSSIAPLTRKYGVF